MGQFEAFVGVNFWTALFVLLNTLTIYFVAKKFLFGPVMKIIHDRQKEIDDMYLQADQTKDQAEQLRVDYEEKLLAAQQTSDRLVKEAVARGKSREEEIIRQANREADAIREKASADIAREKKQAVNDAKNEISSLAMEIAGKVVGQSLDAARQEQLVDSFLEELGEQQ
ncbi:MAG: F0F1 ATP synthase subunit B [Oscillospiraceae bacterium]|nr:F0F1 ATP synthase subunit B [Oscillospiraceae bacterium]